MRGDNGRFIKGHKPEHTKETRLKISLSKLGKKNPMYGKAPWNKNKKLSKEHCINLSISHKGQHSSPGTQFKKGQMVKKVIGIKKPTR